jgi:hypothetical protein
MFAAKCRAPRMTQMSVRLPVPPYKQTAPRHQSLGSSQPPDTPPPTTSVVRTSSQEAAATMAPAQNTRLQLGKRKAQATQGGSPVTKGKTRVAKDKSRVAKGKNQVAEGKKKQAAKGNKKQATVVQTSSLLKLPGELKNR